MADIKIRFEVNPNQESEKLGKVINENAIISNVSYKVDETGAFNIISAGENDGSNGLSFAQDLVFDAQGYLDNEDLLGAVLESEQEPSEFVWGVVPEGGEYSVKITFENATNLKDIVVFGDKTVGQYPTRAIVNGKTEITNDDYKWAINLETESDTHTIEFTNWSRSNYNACLTLIRVMFRYFEVGKNTGLKSVESLAQITGQPQEIYYGVIPSSGSAELIDVNGEFEDLLVDEVIPNSNLHLDVFANGNKIQNHLSVDSDYSGDKILTIELSNSLNNWDKIRFNGMRLRESMSLLDILRYVFKSVGVIESDFEVRPMLTSNIFYQGLYISIEEYLSNIIIPYPYLNSGTLRDAVDKICQLAQLNVVEDNLGGIKFVSSRPILDVSKPILSINPSQIKTNPTRDIILKNKYNNINVEYLNVSSVFVNKDARNITVYDTPTDSDAENVLSGNTNISVIKTDVPYVGNTDSSQTFYSIIKYRFSLDDVDLIKQNFEYKIGYNLSIFKGTETDTVKGDVYGSKIFNHLNGDNIVISNWVDFDTNMNIVSIKDGIGGIDFAVRKEQNSDITVFVLMLNKYLEYSYNHVENKYSILTYYALYPTYNFNFGVGSITTDVKQSLQIADYSLSSNELIQEGTKIYNMSAVEYLSRTIAEDYGKGIATAEIEVICSDLYDINGNMVKDWSVGETYEIGDVIRVDKDKDGNSLWNYKDGTPMYWQIVSRNFKKIGVPIISLQLRECKYSVVPPLTSVSFAEDSWETINTICQFYKAEEYYNVGDEKTITLSNGNQVTLQIWGFNHDNLTSGGKANITIGMKHLLAGTYQMNTSATNSGGWKNCYFRNTTLPQIFATLPVELQSVIKLVDKKCSYGNGTSSTQLVSDSLFLFSEVEVLEYPYYTMAVEGMQYKYWQNLDSNDNTRVTAKALNNGGGSYTNWWLRSPSDTNVSTGSRFSAVYTSGGYLSLTANSTAGICLGFCI